MRNRYLCPVPDYAVELLQAARFMLHGDDPDYRKILEDAVIAFEEAMPILADGSIFVVEPIEREDAE